MVVSGFQEVRAQHTRAYQASAFVILADVPLAKASRMPRPESVWEEMARGMDSGGVVHWELLP